MNHPLLHGNYCCSRPALWFLGCSDVANLTAFQLNPSTVQVTSSKRTERSIRVAQVHTPLRPQRRRIATAHPAARASSIFARKVYVLEEKENTTRKYPHSLLVLQLLLVLGLVLEGLASSSGRWFNLTCEEDLPGRRTVQRKCVVNKSRSEDERI
ncbi:hypothetical protein FN846DRAFT_338398 [Sphaerosporella brunnea]|uniref:Uncharacterized protein n=1 Tax=Sphaerosporella brunnea TaxID=1250544 RepID=A0A5J5EJS7_9PEZI|nr:hypothetical protein FN846DRAFT_338398 [Sphaerosporella brunnea]